MYPTVVTRTGPGLEGESTVRQRKSHCSSPYLPGFFPCSLHPSGISKHLARNGGGAVLPPGLEGELTVPDQKPDGLMRVVASPVFPCV